MLSNNNIINEWYKVFFSFGLGQLLLQCLSCLTYVRRCIDGMYQKSLNDWLLDKKVEGFTVSFFSFLEFYCTFVADNKRVNERANDRPTDRKTYIFAYTTLCIQYSFTIKSPLGICTSKKLTNFCELTICWAITSIKSIKAVVYYYIT